MVSVHHDWYLRTMQTSARQGRLLKDAHAPTVISCEGFIRDIYEDALAPGLHADMQQSSSASMHAGQQVLCSPIIPGRCSCCLWCRA